MHEPGTLEVADCWAHGGRLDLSMAADGALDLSGNAQGYIGLARVLLYLANHGLEDGDVVDLSTLEAHAPGAMKMRLHPSRD